AEELAGARAASGEAPARVVGGEGAREATKALRDPPDLSEDLRLREHEGVRPCEERGALGDGPLVHPILGVVRAEDHEQGPRGAHGLFERRKDELGAFLDALAAGEPESSQGAVNHQEIARADPQIPNVPKQGSKARRAHGGQSTPTALRGSERNERATAEGAARWQGPSARSTEYPQGRLSKKSAMALLAKQGQPW